VVANSRSIKPSSNPDLLTVAGDIGDPATAKSVIDEAVARFGRVDTLVNNPGILIASAFTDYTEEEYRRKLRTNLDGFFFITQRAIPVMLKQGGGHIVQITTTLVEYANSKIPSIVASITKGGLAADAKPGNRIRRTRDPSERVAPGSIKTPLHTPETHESRAKLKPLGRMGEVSDIVQAVLYLEDAGFVTGETLHVDGGQIVGH
jgi:NAD(P)-dependent dehydrogenase (short-subunit alcohol dehydrogenase family)